MKAVFDYLAGFDLTPKDSATLLAAMLAATIAAIIAVFGWFIGNWLTRRRDDRNRRLTFMLERSERQIGEFYAPLLNCLIQLAAISRVKEAFPNDDGDLWRKIDYLLYKDHYLVVHLNIIGILNTKIGLLEAHDTPISFVKYLQHYTSERVKRDLNNQGVERDLYVEPWPEALKVDLDQQLKVVQRSRAKALEALGYPSPSQ